MNFLLSAGAFAALVYWGLGWLHLADGTRLTIAFWAGVIGLLAPVITRILTFILALLPNQSGQNPTKTAKATHLPPLGRFTAGAYDNALTMAPGGRRNIFCRLVIAYVDAQSEITTRIIDVQSYSVATTPDGEIVPLYLDAFCELRQGKRQFRADRIIECALADSEGDGDVTDLLGVLQKAPDTVTFDRKTTILMPVTKDAITIDYQFRAPTFKRVTITPAVVGYTEQSIGQQRITTLAFIDAFAEGKTTSQRFRADRIQNVWTADDNSPIQDLASFLLKPQARRTSVPNS
jgi:hypothetical protein